MTNDCYIPSLGTRGSRKTGDVLVGMMFSIELPIPWQMLAATVSGFGRVMAMVRMTMLWGEISTDQPICQNVWRTILEPDDDLLGLGGFGLGLTGVLETSTKEDMGENSI